MNFPEMKPEFWHSKNVLSVGSDMYVKRHSHGLNDFLHAKMKVDGTMSRFKIPSSATEMLITKMEAMIHEMYLNENGQLAYPGLTEPSTKKEFCTAEFYDNPFTIKVLKFRMRLYLSGMKLTWRLHNEVPEKYHIYKDDVCEWRGPAVNISMVDFYELVEALKTVNAHPDE